jgi:hypothetical protein
MNYFAKQTINAAYKCRGDSGTEFWLILSGLFTALTAACHHIAAMNGKNMDSSLRNIKPQGFLQGLAGKSKSRTT